MDKPNFCIILYSNLSPLTMIIVKHLVHNHFPRKKSSNYTVSVPKLDPDCSDLVINIHFH